MNYGLVQKSQASLCGLDLNVLGPVGNLVLLCTTCFVALMRACKQSRVIVLTDLVMVFVVLCTSHDWRTLAIFRRKTCSML